MNNNTNTNTKNTTDSKAKSPTANGASDTGFQEKVMKQIKELGDSLERVGEKVEKSGLEMIGQAIYKLGNSLEHLDIAKKDPSTEKAYTDKEFEEKSKKSSDLKASA